MTAMMFVGCASNGTANEDKTTENTVTVTDVRGDVEIPADPQRVPDMAYCRRKNKQEQDYVKCGRRESNDKNYGRIHKETGNI